MWSFLLYSAVLSLLISTSTGQSPLQLEREKGYLSGSSEKSEIHPFNTVPGSYRLPRTLAPVRYQLRITPILEDDPATGASQWTAPGDVLIFVDCIQDTTNITLHSNMLEINEDFTYVLNNATRDQVGIASYSKDTEKHFFIINLSETLVQGQHYEIFLRFIAPVSGSDRMDGLYRSFYLDPITETTKWIAATQLESVHARQMFPCFDEPELKAEFDITIGRKSSYKSWSNTELKRSEPMWGLPSWMWDEYESTVPMSTYLVAILVSDDYDCSTADASLYPKQVQVCAPNYLIQKGAAEYGAEISARQLKWLEDYFEIEYKLSKMVSASVPHFGGGAMENWGLNLYRESYLLYIDGETTEVERSRVSEILAHELTHQWLGNLVTNKWWSEMWLKEGFATYFSFVVSQITDPEFEGSTSGLLNNCLQYSMTFASRWDYGHPVFQPVDTPTEIDLMYGRMAYEKAGSLIRMMQGFLTEATFRRGLIDYLRKMEYKGAEQDDLFLSLTNRAHFDRTLDPSITVKQIMDTWTLKKSFPLVRVSRTGENKLLISQEPFNNNDDMGYKGQRFPLQTDIADLWYIPVALITEDEPVVTSHVPKFWIERTTSAKSYAHNTQKWILINPDAYGYYRVLYDSPMTTLLQNQLTRNHSIISPMSRSQLLDDYFNLAFQNYISIDQALQFTQYLTQETEFVVWDAVITNLRKTYSMISGKSALNGFRTYFLPRLAGSLEKIGLEQKSTDKGAVVMHRAQNLDWMCAMEDPECIEYAGRLFDEWMNEPSQNPIPVDLQQIFYCTAVATKGDVAFNFVFQQYKAATIPRQQTLLLNALACATEMSLINTLLEYAKDTSSGLLRNHFTPALQRLAMNPLGRNPVLRFLNDNLSDINTEFGSYTPIANVVTTLSSYLNTKEELETLKHFISSNSDLSPVESSLNTSVENIEINIKWMENYYDEIKKWLEAQL